MQAIGAHQTKVVTLFKLQDMLLTGMIKLDAEYQRDVVWPSTKMTFLIDSIIKNFYIPPLLFSIRTDEEGKVIMVCIDGKQRLTSILRFTQNQIPYLDDSSGFVEEVYFDQDGHNTEKFYQKDHVPIRFFTEQQKSDFFDTEIAIAEFRGLDDDEEIEIYSRVQMGVAITTAEKLTATSSEVSQLCRTYISTHLHLNATLIKLRMSPFRCIAQVLYCIYEESNRFVASYVRLHEFLKDRGKILTTKYKQTSLRTISILDRICNNKRGKEAIHYIYSNDGMIQQPLKNIEFIVFGVFISKSNPGVTVVDFVDDLIDMRAFFRHQHKCTLKVGNPCWLVGMVWVQQRLAFQASRSPVDTRCASSSSTCFNGRGPPVDIIDLEEPLSPLPSPLQSSHKISTTHVRPMARRGGRLPSAGRSSFNA